MSLPFAIIGTGRIAADYLTALERLDELALVGVADLRADVAAATGERWACPAFVDAGEMLEETGARAALVAVPPADHEGVTLACLERGVHVLCEKPFALSVESGGRMLGAAAEAGLVLTMSAKFRHVPDVIEAKARLESGALGSVVLARNVFTADVAMRDRWNADPERGGGGVLIDNGTHSVDLLRYLFGPVRTVQAQRGPDIQGLAVEDTVALTLELDSGPIAAVDLSWSVAAGLPWYLSAHGTAGGFQLGWRGSAIRRSDGDWKEFGSGYDKVDALARQLRHFARAITGDEPLLMGAPEILASIEVVDAGYRSLRADGTRVSLGAES